MKFKCDKCIKELFRIEKLKNDFIKSKFRLHSGIVLITKSESFHPNYKNQAIFGKHKQTLRQSMFCSFFCVALLIIFLSLTSCSSSSPSANNTNNPEKTYAASITIEYTPQSENTSKSLTTYSSLINLQSTKIDNSEYALIKNEFLGKSVTSITFTSVTEIYAVFSDVASSLREIKASPELKRIGSKVFEECKELTLIVFNSNVSIENDTFYSGLNSMFIIPQNQIMQYEKILSQASFQGSITLNLDLNTDKYPNLDKPIINRNKITVLISTKTDAVQVPKTANADFLGFYADKDTTATQITNSKGEFQKSVNGYTDNSGFWTKADNTTIYAHYKPNKGINIYGSTDVNINLNPNSNLNIMQSLILTSLPTGATKLSLSSLPQLKGYGIEGFYADKEFKIKLFNSDLTIVQKDTEGYIKNGKWAYPQAKITLYANWSNLITITLDKNGGESDGSATIVLGNNMLSSFKSAKGESQISYYGDGTEETKDNPIMDPNGTLRKGVSGYTDSDGNWIYNKPSLILYAHYTTTNTSINIH